MNRILTAIALLQTAHGAITATFLPHGPATPANPAWSRTDYRDIPWWFEDQNPVWGEATPGAADAYDISAIWAARLNRNNSSGYEAGIINTPGFSHLGNTNPYGSLGGAFGTSADNIVWGNSTTWAFTLTYNWNNGSPVASMTFVNGATTHTASADLGSRVIDFVEGDIARPLTAEGKANPYREPHQLNDLLMRFATANTTATNPGFTMSSVTVGDLNITINGMSQSINYLDPFGDAQSSLTTQWNHIPGATAETNPRQVQFLLLDDVIPDHTATVELTGNLSFAWEGTVGSISGSGVMFEVKIGDLDLFGPETNGLIPEPQSSLLAGIGAVLLLLRRRRREAA